jgi:hypothetical protein
MRMIEKRFVRRGLRLLVALAGVGQLIAAVMSTPDEPMSYLGGGMFLFIAATNFCSQCPLLSAVQRMFSLRKKVSVDTKKI